jgi:hypothetical protein
MHIQVYNIWLSHQIAYVLVQRRRRMPDKSPAGAKGVWMWQIDGVRWGRWGRVRWWRWEQEGEESQKLSREQGSPDVGGNSNRFYLLLSLPSHDTVTQSGGNIYLNIYWKAGGAVYWPLVCFSLIAKCVHFGKYLHYY